MSAIVEVARTRRAQIVALSLTELMLLLVFMSLAFTFLAKDEGKIEIPRVQRELDEKKLELKQLTKELAAVKKSLVAVQQENDRLDEYIKELTGSADSISPDSNTFPPSTYGIEQLRALAREQRSIIVALQQQISALQTKINGGKAPGLPICTITNHYLVLFTLEADGTFVGAPGWSQEMAFATRDVPGLDQLTSRRALNPDEFNAAAAKVKAWGVSQSQPCTVRVSYTRHTTDAGIFERQLNALGNFFYKAQAQ
jgi:hypothetical protein